MQLVANWQIKLNDGFLHRSLNQWRRMLATRVPIRILFSFIAMALSFSGHAQKITHGIVVDSASLSVLPGVHVRIKNSDRGTSTNSKGEFYIKTNPTDTLLLSSIGYVDLVLPLLFEEEDILIRLQEKVILLKEVVISSTPLSPTPITRSVHAAPRKMSTADAFSSPWDYFTRDQKDRRKATKLINENNRIKTYNEVVHDQLLREDIMREFEIAETEFYGKLAEFNKQNQGVLLYSTDKNEIVTSLKSFFEKAYKRKR
jgi:hypothetical protein